MASFVHIGGYTVNLCHVCSAVWASDGSVVVGLDNGGTLKFSGAEADELAVAVGREVATFEGVMPVDGIGLAGPPVQLPNGLKELDDTPSDERV